MVTNQFNDPLFQDQWHLSNTGQGGLKPEIDINVVPVWQDYTGKGVKVAILEGGATDITHPDLAPNYDNTLDFNAISNNGNISVDRSRGHATATAGIIGAAANNGIGGVGIAYDSTIANFQFDYGFTSSQVPVLFQRAIANGIDVINNSWGSSTPFSRNFGESRWNDFAAGLESLVRDGRNGNGIIVVKSAGNYRREEQWSNGSNFTNSPYTITVGGIGGEGDYRSSSSPGANLLVSAPTRSVTSVGIVTTDIAGSGGYNNGDYTTTFSGTSASAPMVSGVVALMLQANPNLGYRDVQEILAYTARRYILNEPAPGDQPWSENAANNSNGGGLHYNNDYGFGLVDALAAVRLAETWEKQQVFTNEQVIPLSTTTSRSGVDANGNAFIESEITVNSALELDQIQVNLDLQHRNTGELNVVLVAPSGTRSILINSETVYVSTSGNVTTYADGQGRSYPGNSFQLSSTNFWGESAQGTWKIIVTDTRSNSNNSTFNGWTLTLRGDTASDNDTYIYTDEFANFTTDAARKTLEDASGIDTINAAAVTSNIRLDLTSGSTNTIAGNTLTIGNTTVIENVFAGDGSDRLLGNRENNTIKAGRGNDYIKGRGGRDDIFGNAGDDTLKGGNDGDILRGNAGNDLLLGGNGKDDLRGASGNDTLNGNSGNDTLNGGSGSDLFVFDNLNLGIDTISDFNTTEGDKIQLSATVFGIRSIAGVLDPTQFAEIGSSDSTSRIIYDSTSGGLFFDADGNGVQQQVQFASVGANLTLSNNDFVVVA